ncbi:MAG: hypothetical protein R2880_15635 [Deinococcales bacterium]
MHYAEHLIELLAKRKLLDCQKIVFKHLVAPRHLAEIAHKGSIYGIAPHSLFDNDCS